MSCQSTSLALSCFRSRMIERLPRLQAMKLGEWAPEYLRPRRDTSPAGASTLMTSAPWSASIAVVAGPETTLVEFDDTGHTPTLRNDEQVDVIRDWLAEN